MAEALAKEDQSTVNSGDMGRNPETQPIPDFGYVYWISSQSWGGAKTLT